MKGCFIICISLVMSITICKAQLLPKDNTVIVPADTSSSFSYQNAYAALLDSHIFLRNMPASVYYGINPKKSPNKSALFYAFALVLIWLGCIRSFYPRYFNALFKVFFNTSLKQSQLTEQLSQASVPALLCNILFFVSAAIFTAILAQYFYPYIGLAFGYLAAIFGLGLAISYTVKYLALQFLGWVMQQSAYTDAYIFIIFLINKVLAVFLLPISIMAYFGDSRLTFYMLMAGIILVGFLFLIRFLRSYANLQHKLSVSRFHFFLYIFCAEVLPIVLICKAVVVYLNKTT